MFKLLLRNNNNSNSNHLVRLYFSSSSSKQPSDISTIQIKDVGHKRNVLKISPVNRYDKNEPLLDLSDILNKQPLLKNATPSKLIHNNQQHSFYFEFDKSSDLIDTFRDLKRQEIEFIERNSNDNSNNSNTKKIVLKNNKYDKNIGGGANKFKFNLLVSSLDPLYTISQAEIDSLPPASNDSLVHVVDDVDQVSNAVKLLLNGKSVKEVKSTDNIKLAVDCEWPGLRKFLVGEKSKVSLIQITNGVDTVLFRVCRFGIPEPLKQLLQSNNILKIGHGISKDANRILDDLGVLMENIYDSHYHPIVLRMNSRKLPFVIGKFFGVNISRSRTMTVSNWATSEDLSESQIETASNEVYFARKLYFELQDKKYNVDIDLTKEIPSNNLEE